MSESRTTPDRSPIDYHDVMIAIEKARAAAELADICSYGSDYLQMGNRVKDETETLGWIQSFAFEALDQALNEAEAAFRKSQKAA